MKKSGEQRPGPKTGKALELVWMSRQLDSVQKTTRLAGLDPDGAENQGLQGPSGD